MRKTAVVFLVVAVCLLTSASPALHAQATASGTILGTVLDKSQAVVTAADVVVHQ